MSRKRKTYLTPIQRREVAMLYKDGATAIELARAYDVGENTVYKAVAAHGVPRHYPKLSAALKTAYVARLEQVEEPPAPQSTQPTPPLQPRLKYVPPRKLDDAQRAEIRRLYIEGVPAIKIATAFKVHLTTIYSVLDEANIGRHIPHKQHKNKIKPKPRILALSPSLLPPLPPPQPKSWLRRMVDRFIK